MPNTTPWSQIKPIPRKPPPPEFTMIQRIYKHPKPRKYPVFIKNTQPTNTVLKHIATSLHGDYGYNIRKSLNLCNGTIYAILHRLEAFGWIESWWAYGIENGERFQRPRKYYEITPLGLTKAQERKLI